MIDPPTPHAFAGSKTPTLVGEQPASGRFGVRYRADNLPSSDRLPSSDNDDRYASGYAAGMRDVRDELHGRGIFALAVGTAIGTASGIFYRELTMAVGSLLGY